MERNLGIWVDSHHAFIIALQEGEEYIHTIDNNLESYQRKEGYRGKTAWHAQDVGSEVKEDRRRANQMHRFFQAIIDKSRSATRIYIFGPSTAKLGLEKEFKKEPQLYSKVIAIESADKMTETRMVSHVKEYFRHFLHPDRGELF